MLLENQYNIKSYRADSKKFQVYLPGEYRNTLANKPKEITEKIENFKVEKYIKQIEAGHFNQDSKLTYDAR